MASLALFDLDHTLLTGDTDVLWCEYLMERGILDRASFSTRNAQMEQRYREGSVDPQAFADFYVSTLAGRGPALWEPVRQDFFVREVLPRIPQAARALVRGHQQAGDLVVLTTATNRFLTEPTAASLGIAHLLATEVEQADGVFTGRTRDTLNMRAGKVLRLQAWLANRGQKLEHLESTAYSDSINDLPLLEAVQRPVAVDPDARLASIAAERGWRVLHLDRTPATSSSS
ncbi:MAG TPA: HAD family hydrolase [Ramlibacter sp.]|jgi:HAD superfamily hydrolase (TIGR01490 family)